MIWERINSEDFIVVYFGPFFFPLWHCSGLLMGAHRPFLRFARGRPSSTIWFTSLVLLLLRFGNNSPNIPISLSVVLSKALWQHTSPVWLVALVIRIILSAHWFTPLDGLARRQKFENSIGSQSTDSIRRQPTRAVLAFSSNKNNPRAVHFMSVISSSISRRNLRGADYFITQPRTKSVAWVSRSSFRF